MNKIHKLIKVKTKAFLEFVDLTDQIEELIKLSKVNAGMVMVFSKHTTGAIRINEKEKGIVKDFTEFATKFLPADKYYHHNDLTERTENLVCDPNASDSLNGHSHLLHLMMGATSETIAIEDGKLMLGTWQKIFFIELDRARPREIIVKIIGE